MGTAAHFALSTQSSGFESSGSSISFGGLKGGSKSSSRLPSFFTSPSTRTWYLTKATNIAVSNTVGSDLARQRTWGCYRLLSSQTKVTVATMKVLQSARVANSLVVRSEDCGIDVSVGAQHHRGRRLEVLLFYGSVWSFVAEDQVHLEACSMVWQGFTDTDSVQRKERHRCLTSSPCLLFHTYQAQT